MDLNKPDQPAAPPPSDSQQPPPSPYSWDSGTPAPAPESATTPPPAPSPSSGPRYAGFWKRVAATIIDGIIIGIPLYVIVMIASMIVGVFLGIGMEMSGSFFSDIMMNLTSMALSTVINFLLFFIPLFLYKSMMESSKWQATLGKMILGIKVTNLEGGRITYGTSAGRYFAMQLNNFTLNLLYIMAGVTQKKQALHDMMFDTLVVDK